MRTAYFQLSAIFQRRAENEYMWQRYAYGLEYSSNLRIMKIKVHRMPAFPLNMEDWWFPLVL